MCYTIILCTVSLPVNSKFLILPLCRRMFWSNWHSSQPGIQRAFFSGYSAMFIVKTDISTPNGLAIDHKEQFLYWIDARLDKIERCDFDGNQRFVSRMNAISALYINLFDINIQKVSASLNQIENAYFFNLM